MYVTKYVTMRMLDVMSHVDVLAAAWHQMLLLMMLDGCRCEKI